MAEVSSGKDETKNEAVLGDENANMDDDEPSSPLAVDEEERSAKDHTNNMIKDSATKTTSTANDDVAETKTKKDEWEELMGQDLLLKHIKSNKEGQMVQPQDSVVVSFVGRLAETRNYDTNDDNSSSSIFQTANEWLLVIGEKDVLPALELGIRFMRVGETAQIWSHSKYAYGPGQRRSSSTTTTSSSAAVIVPQHANVCYTVQLHRVVTPETTKTRQFQLELCQSKKNIANDIYNHEIAGIQNNAYSKSRALYIYKRAAEMLDYMLQQHYNNNKDDSKENADDDKKDDEKVNDDDDDDAFDVAGAETCLLDCLNNIAAVHFTVKEYHTCKEACVNVLQHDPDNTTALLRAAKSAMLDASSSFDEVQAAIDAAMAAAVVDNDKNNKQNNEKIQNELKKLQAELNRRKQQHKQREKQMYSKMLPTTKPQQQAATTKDELKQPAESDSLQQQQQQQATDDSTSSSNGRVVAFLKELPWKKTILPNAMQMILPFVSYYVIMLYRRRQEDNGQGKGDGDDEL